MAPLGARWTPDGASFAVYSTADSVQLCLLSAAGSEDRLDMTADQQIWTIEVPGVEPGQLYGFRAAGSFDPSRGKRFDATRLLADPYGRAFAPPTANGELPAVVVDHTFDWGDDRPLRIDWSHTVLYETHVAGMTRRHPGVEPNLRGTYLGLAQPAVLDHLTGLGVTAVELLPVQQFRTENRLAALGLENYWGYMTIGFFAPHAGYRCAAALGAEVAEFKTMVKAMHAAGLEVILDVVYNHTAEGPSEPTIAFRGLANDTYYRLDPANPARYVDDTGTGNTTNVDNRETLRLIMDSLRYWVTDMHVDGFRFDLAATLARDRGSFDQLAAFFDLVYQDPVIADVKLIAEPWDIETYQQGNFPLGWAEWNDHYRDDVRDFWRRAGPVNLMGNRLTGSSDRFSALRGPDASVNFITAHDGKTLRDLVSYAGKHNEANGENNADGADFDRAENFGVEGETDDPAIVGVRARQCRNFIATLLLSQGVPMLLGGDERGRTQRGNNNAYCQDNEISWYDWTPSAAADVLTAFTARAIALQHAHPVLQRRAFLRGDGDIAWFDSTGTSMSAQRWKDPANHFIAYLLAGDRADLPDDDVLVILNADEAPAVFVVPGAPAVHYTVLLDTGADDGAPTQAGGFDAGGQLTVPPRTAIVASAQRH
jgi:isoamylase